MWMCASCTFAENRWESSSCEVCEQPAPSNKVAVGFENIPESPEKEQKMDISEFERQMA